MTCHKLIISLAFAVSTAACGSSADSATAQASACLQQHTGKLDSLLTKQDITPYVQGAVEDVETDYDKQFEHKITYSWPSDRTRTIMGNEYPTDNRIGLGGVETYTDEDFPVKRFERAHHNMTPQEKKKARAAINAALQKQGQTSGKAGNAILGAATSRIKFDAVSGIGDAAAWDHMDTSLDVLTGNTEFSVTADVSADIEKNKVVAKELAQSVLSECTVAD